MFGVPGDGPDGTMEREMNQVSPRAALLYPLAKVARELDECSPELRQLLTLALTGANGEPFCTDCASQAKARMRLNEAVTTRTKDAVAERKAVRKAGDLTDAEWLRVGTVQISA